MALKDFGDPNHIKSTWLERQMEARIPKVPSIKEIIRESDNRRTKLATIASEYELRQINKKLDERTNREAEEARKEAERCRSEISYLTERLNKMETEKITINRNAVKEAREEAKTEIERKYSGYVSPESTRQREERLKAELEGRTDRKINEVKRETESKYRGHVSPEQVRKYIEETVIKTTAEARKGYIIEEEVRKQAEEAKKNAEEDAKKRSEEASKSKEKEIKYKALRSTVEYTGATEEEIAEALSDKVVAKSKLEKTVEEFDQFKKVVKSTYEKRTEKPRQAEPKREEPKPERIDYPTNTNAESSSSGGERSNSGPMPLLLGGIAALLFMGVMSSSGRTKDNEPAKPIPAQQIQYQQPNYEQPIPMVRYAVQNESQPEEKPRVIYGSFTPKNQQSEEKREEERKKKPFFQLKFGSASVGS